MADPATPASPGPTPPQGGAAILSIVSTWVFALLPANLVPLVVGQLVDRFGVGLGVAGIVATVMTLTNATAVLSVRPVVARGRRGLVSALGVAVMVGAYLVAALLPVVPVVLTALVVGGAGAGMMIGAATAAVSSVADPDRITALGMVVNRIVVAGVFLLIPALGASFEAIMWVLIGLGLVTFALSRRLPPPARAPIARRAGAAAPTQDATAASPSAPGPVPPSPGDGAGRGLAWVLAVAFAAWTVTEEGTYALIEIFVGVNIPDLDAADLSVVYAGAVITGLIGALCAPLLVRLVGRTTSLAVVLAISIGAKLVLATGTAQDAVLIAGLVWGFAFGAVLPLIFGLAAAAAADGSVSVLVNGVYTVGVALGPLVGTQLFALGTPTAVGAALALLGAVSALVSVVVVRRLDARLGFEHGARTAPERVAA